MQKLARMLVTTISAGRDLRVPAHRVRIGLIEGWSSIVGNLALTLVKTAVGLTAGSISLLADAAHTLSDITSSVVVLVGFSLAGKGPDRAHPFGHGRVEYLAGLAVSLILVSTGGAFIAAAIQRLAEGAAHSPSVLALSVVMISILVKEMMYHFSLQLGKLIDSEALIADAWHHRTDSITSLLVLLALAGRFFNLHFLDAACALVVACFIIYTGINLARRSVHRLVGTAPSQSAQQEILEAARQVGGVVGAHSLEIHDYGAHKAVVLHIEVNGELTLIQAHDIAQTVELVIARDFYCQAVVHIDPCRETRQGAI